ncbi:hypothetical protein M0638_00070 [Roseomonas sp. NAR14]|uniref:Uncharacterized protein n=1 Tax=Roseomonas acroporae TaxID=2937791 RepID=A0A9X2BVI5_9PROT|nr:hypothetical protein [Roseomonas acroporae]MCK8782775.1 hypothetical protein [Roseomonas acroporae]
MISHQIPAHHAAPDPLAEVDGKVPTPLAGPVTELPGFSQEELRRLVMEVVG